MTYSGLAQPQMSFLPREYSYPFGKQNSGILGVGISQARVNVGFSFWNLVCLPVRQEISKKGVGSVAYMTECGQISPRALAQAPSI